MEKTKFVGVYGVINKKAVNYSKKTQPTFKEIAPFARDENGKFLNESADSILVKGPDWDIDAYIQSFADDVDLYKIFNRCVDANTTEFIDLVETAQGDATQFSDNYQDNFDTYQAASQLDVKALQEENAKLKEEQAKKNEELSKQIEALNAALLANKEVK